MLLCCCMIFRVKKHCILICATSGIVQWDARFQPSIEASRYPVPIPPCPTDVLVLIRRRPDSTDLYRRVHGELHVGVHLQFCTVDRVLVDERDSYCSGGTRYLSCWCLQAGLQPTCHAHIHTYTHYTKYA